MPAGSAVPSHNLCMVHSIQRTEGGRLTVVRTEAKDVNWICRSLALIFTSFVSRQQATTTTAGRLSI